MKRRKHVLIAVLVLGAIAGVAGYAYWFFFRRTLPVRFSEPLDRFKYSSIGAEVDSMPFLIWKVLPEVCPDLLPGGYGSLGLIFEDGRSQPIGMSIRTVGVPRIGLNCAGCHTGTVRLAEGAAPQIVPGMPNQRFDFQRYVRFLMLCGTDGRFTPATVVQAIERHDHLSTFEAFMYRRFVVPRTRSILGELRGRFAWFDERDDFGPGRFDVPSSLKSMLGVKFMRDSIGTVEYPQIWNQARRATQFYQHWDGNSPLLTERDHSTALAIGARPESVDQEELRWLEGWLQSLSPPPYPLPIDRALAAKGEQIYDKFCESCHDTRAGDVTPIPIVGTDRRRLDANTLEMIEKLNQLGTAKGTRANYRKTDGYLNVLLDGIWARAPYLHNGSVPNLRELLEPEDKRSRVFYRGSDLFDAVNVGFVSTGPSVEATGFRFDTRRPGNGNQGHVYGADLTPAQKAALLEFLKTR